MTPATFRALVWRYYRLHGRHDLPWRPTSPEATKGKKDDLLYRVLVSEIMLQQTQVDRVIPFYNAFIKRFPTAKRLATAPLAEVLVSWQGLGYNRRAKMLHSAAKILAATSRSNLEVAALEELPGVGPYTARAVAAFACNQDAIVIETNIRTAVIHHYFQDHGHRKSIADAEIAAVLEQVLPKGRSREWYSALMDYGAHLKRSGVSHNARTKTYMKQAKFAGSLRQARGAIVKRLAGGPASRAVLMNALGAERRGQMDRALEALIAEGFVAKQGRGLILAD